MKFTQLAIVILAIALVGWLFWWTGNKEEGQEGQEDVLITEEVRDEEDVRYDDGGVNLNDQEKTAEAEGEENIVVTAPEPNSTITSPVTITGSARVFENTVNVAFRDTEGTTKIQEIAIARAPDIGQFGDFAITIHYNFSATKEGTIEVFSLSAKDGSEIDTVVIPVKFE